MQGIGIFAGAPAKARRSKAQTFQPRFSLICRKARSARSLPAVLNYSLVVCFFKGVHEVASLRFWSFCFKTKGIALAAAMSGNRKAFVKLRTNRVLLATTYPHAIASVPLVSPLCYEFATSFFLTAITKRKEASTGVRVIMCPIKHSNL